MLPMIHPPSGLNQSWSPPKTNQKTDRHECTGDHPSQDQSLVRKRNQLVNRHDQQPKRRGGKKTPPTEPPAALPPTTPGRFFKGALDDLNFAHGLALTCNS